MRHVIALTAYFCYYGIFINMIRLKTLLFEQEDKFMLDLWKKQYSQYVAVIKTHDANEIVNKFPDKIMPVSSYSMLFNLFKDKRTGYDSLTAMIRGEFDAVKDKLLLDRLSQMMSTSGITNQRVPNAHIKIIRLDSSTADAEYQSGATHKAKEQYNALLPKVRDWWLKWLNNPKTIQKMVTNINGDKSFYSPDIDANWLIKTIYPVYYKVLNSLEFRYFNPNMQTRDNKYKNIEFKKGNYAFVNPSIPSTVFINITQPDAEAFDTLIHEVQHLLWNKYPMNPTEQLLKIFNNKSSSIFSFDTDNDASVNNQLQVIASKYKISTMNLNVWKQWQEEKEKTKPGYTSSPTEKMSNIQSVRNYFKLKPGQSITIEMLRPYIIGAKEHTDVYWLLMGWAAAKFPDLQQFVNSINKLASNDMPNNQNIT